MRPSGTHWNYIVVEVWIQPLHHYAYWAELSPETSQKTLEGRPRLCLRVVKLACCWNAQ